MDTRETGYCGTWGVSRSSQGSAERLSFCTCGRFELCFSQVHIIVDICKAFVFLFVFVMARVRGIWTLKELDFEVYQLQVPLGFVSFRKIFKIGTDL